MPAISTAAAILKRNGLVVSPNKRRKPGHPGPPQRPMDEPNSVWCGEFKLGTGHYCYPLTVTDGFSRYLLECKGLVSTATDTTQAAFSRLFHEFGLPYYIRSDNGTPFASTAIARLSRLSVWWIKLGVYPDLTQPGKPQQNGRHERMHRTLKAETTKPPAHSMWLQQERFDRFIAEYNDERPHEALGQQTPWDLYRASDRQMPSRIPAIEYPDHWEVRRVSTAGHFRWKNRHINLSHVLETEYIGLHEVDYGIWAVHFGPVELGWLNEKTMKVEDKMGRSTRK